MRTHAQLQTSRMTPAQAAAYRQNDAGMHCGGLRSAGAGRCGGAGWPQCIAGPSCSDSLERSSVQACHRALTWSLTGLRVGAA